MKIDMSRLEKKYWFEDINGNEVDKDSPEAVIYRHCFPCTLSDEIDEYCYHPKNLIMKWLLRRLPHNGWLYKKLTKGKDKTFRNIMTGNTHYGSEWSQRCIVAMVNSGDYTLEQAIWVYANSCERCMNVLLYKYLNGEDGYKEYSEEWKKCNTVCDFCRDEQEAPICKKS